MSQFLGRQDCIESLRKDLVDLQGAVLDVFSRTGPVRFSSWKFPDKLSCNLDMVVLLEQYDFVDGEDAFNQHSHIVLLELVIDRLLLLLQSFNCYVEQLRCRRRREDTQHTGCQSVGLVVRNYWSNLVQLSNCKDRKPQTCDGETETASSVSSHMSSASDGCRPALAAWPSTDSLERLPQNRPSSGPNPKNSLYPRDSVCSVSCQTVEPSLVPCDACRGVQSLLRRTGEALVELLRAEGLPCSLQPLLAAVEDTVGVGDMTAGDVAQWAGEQLRDTRRLAKHLQEVRGTVRPLRDQLAASEAERKQCKARLDKARNEFERETEKRQANVVQLEFSLRKAQRCVKETEQRLQEEQQQRRREMLNWEEGDARLKEKAALQQDSLQALACENKALQEKVRTLQRLEHEARCDLQERVQQLEGQISETRVLLDKESAKYRSACRQQESMQAKQRALLERVNVLDEDREDLQRQLDESEERQADLRDQLRRVAEEKEQQRAQLLKEQDLYSELHREKQILETRIGNLQNTVTELKEHVDALQERERLLVAFPELSPPTQDQPQTTGNVLLDMEQQLRANNTRIQVLEKENSTLHGSLEKLRQRAQQHASTTSGISLPSTPLEKQQSAPTQMHSPLESSSDARAGFNNRGKEARGGDRDLEPEALGDRVSAATPSSLQVHVQSLHLNTGATVAKGRAKTHSASVGGSNYRRK
ncbi:coiled-coil domain-containing protein 157 isoform X2 [Betta splendens]|uniref:Coiled-coil domain-containing protein 157 isoform X2 n=1 Tax=Betta splendens TaxID=158456 RepID=A0A9W2Y0A3_BETSP|nr:coiled-coil domain-containing protein 157 isoform X2 [Betta splendens]